MTVRDATSEDDEKRVQTSSGIPSITANDVEASGEPNKELDASSSEQEDTNYLEGIKLFMVMTGITVVMLLCMLDIAIITTAIPQITTDFHRLEDVGWYIGAYQLASATAQPLTGKLYSHFSLKLTYLVFFVIFLRTLQAAPPSHGANSK